MFVSNFPGASCPSSLSLSLIWQALYFMPHCSVLKKERQEWVQSQDYYQNKTQESGNIRVERKTSHANWYNHFICHGKRISRREKNLQEANHLVILVADNLCCFLVMNQKSHSQRTIYREWRREEEGERKERRRRSVVTFFHPGCCFHSLCSNCFVLIIASSSFFPLECLCLYLFLL